MREYLDTQRSRRLLAAVIVALGLAPCSAAQYKIIYNFGSVSVTDNQSVPEGPPLLDRNGNLYGTSAGPGLGLDGHAQIFKLTPQPGGGVWTESTLYQFASSFEGFLDGPLTMDQSGNLYGTTEGYLSSYAYELSPGSGRTWSFTPLYTNYAGPGLVLDSAGNLYGSIGLGQYNYGAMGELSPGSGGWTYTALYSFPCATCADGSDDPPDPPVFDAEGNLYGTTTEGGINTPPCYGQNGCGVIFKLTHNSDGTWTYEVLHRFGSYPTDGLLPYGSLVMDGSGNFYGTTLGGGKYGYGTIYKLTFTDNQWEKIDLFDAPSLLEGQPDSTLALDQAGNLYGAAGGGLQLCGGFACGSVFKLTRKADNQWEYSALHLFTGRQDGFGPLGVVVDANGNVFGTTATGGLYFSGVAFEITQ